MKILDSSRLAKRESRDSLPTPQIRVMQVLARAKGPLTRAKISDRIGYQTGVVAGRAIGYSDPDKRAAFEQTKDGGGSPGNPCPSLLTLGYVREHALDIDGLVETGVELTPKGRQAYHDLGLGSVDCGPIRD